MQQEKQNPKEREEKFVEIKTFIKEKKSEKENDEECKACIKLNEEEEEVQEEEEEQWEVQKILEAGIYYEQEGKKLVPKEIFKIKWKHSWLPKENLEGCKELIEKFLKNHKPKLMAKPANLKKF